MGLITFFLIAFAVLLIVYLFTMAIDTFLPGHPPIVNKIAWWLGVGFIVVLLIQVTGILKYDPKIPSF